MISKGEDAKLVKPTSRATSSSGWTPETKTPESGKGKRKSKDDSVSYCFAFEKTGECKKPVRECPFPHLSKNEVEALKAKKAACAIEMCMPATTLQEVPRHRGQTHKLACVQVVEATSEILRPEDAMFPAAASLNAMSSESAPKISRQDFYKHLCG
mgnify:CR=1 FL=1